MMGRAEVEERGVQSARGRDQDTSVGGVLLPKPRGRPLAAVSGVVAAAMMLLALLAALAFVLTGIRSVQQPRAAPVIVQVVAAVVVLGLQRVVDRRRGRAAAACAAAVAAITAAMLWVYWIG
jgi:hypothetical protein